MIELLILLFIKHYIVDFPLQSPFPYMWKNKGILWHPGGLLHSGLHSLITLGILFWFAPNLWWLALMEFILHYFTDLSKIKLQKKYNLNPDTDVMYWNLLGLDQLIHALTYIIIAGVIF